jgi:hypothetical protein
MSSDCRIYRGLELYLFVFPRRQAQPGCSHNYEDGFNAAVRICEPSRGNGVARSRVFRLSVATTFSTSGDARRALNAFAEHLIDECSGAEMLWQLP